MNEVQGAPGAPKPDVPVKAEAKPQNPPEMGKSEVNALGSAFKIERVKGWFNREKQLQGIARIAKAYGEARDTAKSGNTEDQLTPEQKAAGETLMNRYSTVTYAEGNNEQQGSLEAGLSDQQRYLIDNVRAQVLENHAIDTQPKNGEYGEGQHTDIVVRKDERGHLVVTVVTGNRGEYAISDDGTEVVPNDATQPLTVEVVQYDLDDKKGILDVASPDEDLRDQRLSQEPIKIRGIPEEVYKAYAASLKEDANAVIDSVVEQAQQNAYVMTLTPRELAGYNVKVLDIQAKNPPITPDEKKKQDGKALREVGRLIADGKYNADNPPTVYAGNDAYREVADRVTFKDGKPEPEESEANENGDEEAKTPVKVAASVDGLTRHSRKEVARLAGVDEGNVNKLDFQESDEGNGVVKGAAIDRLFRVQGNREESIALESLTFGLLLEDDNADPAELVMALAPDEVDDLMTADDALATVQDRIRQIAEEENRSVRDIAREQFAQLLRKELGLDASEDTADVSDQNAPANTIDVSQAISQGQELSTGQMASILEQNSRTQARDQESTTNPDEEAARAEQLEARMNQLVDRLYPADPASRAREIAFNDEDVTNATEFRAAVLDTLRGTDMTPQQQNELADNLLLSKLREEYQALQELSTEDRVKALDALRKRYGDFEDTFAKLALADVDREYPGRPTDERLEEIRASGTNEERRAAIDSGLLSALEVKAMEAAMTPDVIAPIETARLMDSGDRAAIEAAIARPGYVPEELQGFLRNAIKSENAVSNAAQELGMDEDELRAFAILRKRGYQIAPPAKSEAA